MIGKETAHRNKKLQGYIDYLILKCDAVNVYYSYRIRVNINALIYDIEGLVKQHVNNHSKGKVN